MKNIIFAFFSIVFLFVFAAYSFAQTQDKTYKDVTLSNGSSSSGSSGGYQNTSSVNSGIVFPNTLTTNDYRLDTGVLAVMSLSNNDIVFSSPTPTEVSTATLTIPITIQIGITVQTLQGHIRQVKFRVSNGTVPDSSLPFTTVYSSNSASVPLNSGTFYATSSFTPGLNYIQWYAQNDISADGNIGTFILNVPSLSNVTILKPQASAEPVPDIKADIVAVSTFTQAMVKIYIDKGASISTTTVTPLYQRNGSQLTGVNGVTVSSSGLNATVNYKYDGIGAETLNPGAQYTMMIAVEYPTNPFMNFYSTSTFTVGGGPIPTLIPYPSPYNPKSGDTMKIKYALAEPSSVTITIRDRSGRIVRKLTGQPGNAGLNIAEWDGRTYSGDTVANGVYICEIIAKGGKENRRYVSFAVLRK